MDASKSHTSESNNAHHLLSQLLTKPPQKSVIQTSSGSGVSVQVLSSSRAVTSGGTVQRCMAKYSYKVKLINPAKKTDVLIRHLNQFTSQFHSVTGLRMQLMEEFCEQVPSTADFNVGYFETNQQSKVLLVTSEDLKVMYSKCPSGGSLTLWCDARVPEHDVSTRKRKKDGDKGVGRRQEQEDEVNDYFKTLLDQHKEKYTTPQYRLWSRMLASGIHDSTDDPPDIPAFSMNPPKRKRKDTLSDSLTGAAIAFANTLSPVSTAGPSTVHCGGLSPGKTVELRMKNYEQLRVIQQLFDDNILDENEYKIQKNTQ